MKKDLSNQINPNIYTLFPVEKYYWENDDNKDNLTKSKGDTDNFKVYFSARIDTIKGIGPRSAVKISGALKIRNRIDDLASHSLLDSHSVNEVISKYVYSELETVTEFIRMATIQYQKKPRVSFTPSCYNRDIFFEIIRHIPQIGICLNKYWRNYILKNSELRSLLPSRCITCGKIFKYHKICHTSPKDSSHIIPLSNWMTSPRISLVPISSSFINFQLKFTRAYDGSFKDGFTVSSTWTESWYPLYPIGGVGQPELWVYTRIPEVGTYKWNHYDFWMIQKFFDGTDYCVRKATSAYNEVVTREIPGLCIKMPREKMVNSMVRWEKTMYLNN